MFQPMGGPTLLIKASLSSMQMPDINCRDAFLNLSFGQGVVQELDSGLERGTCVLATKGAAHHFLLAEASNVTMHSHLASI